MNTTSLDAKFVLKNFWNYFWRVPPFLFLFRAYYSLRSSRPVWFYLLNHASRKHFQQNPSHLNAVQERIVRELNENGISVSHFNDLFPGFDFQPLQDRAQRYLQDPAKQAQIKIQERDQQTGKKKKYLVELWEKPFCFDPADPLMAVSIHERVLDPINTYLKISSHVSYMNLWYTLPMLKAANYSQRWHRDPDDRSLVKLFLYLFNVEPGGGPFCFVPGSHDLGPYRRTLPSKPPYSTYPKDGDVEKHFSKDQIKICTGKAGTMIFCDTRGLHKGGHAAQNPRYLYNVVYLTDGAIPSEKNKVNFYLNGGLSGSLSLKAKYALSWAGRRPTPAPPTNA